MTNTADRMTFTRDEVDRAIGAVTIRFHLVQMQALGWITARETCELAECNAIISSLPPELRSAAVNAVAAQVVEPHSEATSRA